MLYKMSVEDNIGYAKRNIVDSIYKEAKLEGVAATFLDTKTIFEGGIANGVKVGDIVKINNLKHAWQFILDTLDIEVDVNYVRHLNMLIGAGTTQLRPGELRIVSVDITGTDWKPELPDYDKVKNTLSRLRNESEPLESRILGTFAQICRGQWFYDSNKRTAQLVANKELIAHGAGVLAIPVDKKGEWEEKLLEYYTTGNEEPFVRFVSDTSISGLDLPEKSSAAGKESLVEIFRRAGLTAEGVSVLLEDGSKKSLENPIDLPESGKIEVIAAIGDEHAVIALDIDGGHLVSYQGDIDVDEATVSSIEKSIEQGHDAKKFMETLAARGLGPSDPTKMDRKRGRSAASDDPPAFDPRGIGR